MILENKVAVVTGGASGIGEAITQRFAAEGARVYLGDINAGAAELVAKDCGAHVKAVACDVTKEGDVRALVQAAVDEWGQLDVMVNNAGIEVMAPTIATSVPDWMRTLDVNLTGVFYGCQIALMHMVPAGGGVILNTASIAGTWGAPNLAAYAASKGGVVQLSRALAIENARFGVRCNAICPGLIDTPMGRRATEALGGQAIMDRLADGVPMGRWGRPQEIAALAAFLASDDAAYITAQAVIIDGGLSAGLYADPERLLREAQGT